MPTSKFYTRKHLVLAASIIMILAAAILAERAWARPAQVQPIAAPDALVRARAACPDRNTTCLLGALRKAYAGLEWAKRERLHARSITASNLTPLEVGRALAQRHGWTGRQWVCLVTLWSRESGWKTSNPNPQSQADGIPQANPASKMASAGADWRTNPATQIRWGLSYIRARYGSPCGALHHSDAHGYY